MIGLISYWKTFICVIFMLVLFLLPADNISKSPPVTFASEAVHIFLFSLFTLVLIRDSVRNKFLAKPRGGDYLVALFVGILFGIVVELLQKISGLGRSAEFKDVLYDFTGCVLSIVLLTIYYQLKQKSQSKD